MLQIFQILTKLQKVAYGCKCCKMLQMLQNGAK